MAAIASERRLAAILADVVGYSRLVEKDEAGTLTAIRKLRAEVIDPLLAKHHGRIVKLMGDGAIAEFGSAVDAVRCAIAMQKECTALQADIQAGRRIVFRIGINLGDVVVEGVDLRHSGANSTSPETGAEGDGREVCQSNPSPSGTGRCVSDTPMGSATTPYAESRSWEGKGKGDGAGATPSFPSPPSRWWMSKGTGTPYPIRKDVRT